MMSSAMDLGGDVLRAIIYIQNGYMDWSQWFYIPLLAAVALAGTYVGKKILSRIKQKNFEKIVSVMILLSGIALMFK